MNRLILFVLYSLLCCAVYADNSAGDRSSYQERIHTILEGPDFTQKKLETGWRLKARDSEKEEEEDDDTLPKWFVKIIEWLESLNDKDSSKSNGGGGFFTGIASLIELVFWIAVVFLVGYLLYHFRDTIKNAISGLKSDDEVESIPTNIAGFDIRKASLPDDVVASAKKYWQQQECRQAISLLYRASLSRLVHDYHCRLLSSYTEEECYQASVKLGNKAVSHFMRDITRDWQKLAYGHLPLTTETFESLCRNWNETFKRSVPDKNVSEVNNAQ